MRRVSGRLRPRGPSSLRARLTVWVAGVLVLSAALVFVVVYLETGTQLRDQITRDVRGDAAQLSQVLRAAGTGRPAGVLATARRYVVTQPYGATSTLLFVIVPGAGLMSNHPEVFGGRAPDDGESVAEQAQENAAAAALRTPHPGLFTAVVPDVGHVRVLERPVRAGGVAAVVGAGEPLYLVERAQHGVATGFLLAGGGALLLALVASYFAGARVTAPLRRMAGVAARVDAGDLDPRMEVTGGTSSEMRVLGESFNHMLDRLAEAFRGQREFVADASHELRTPLTVIRGQLEVLAAQDEVTREEFRRVESLVQAEVSRVSRLVDDLLVLAQSERADFLRTEPVDLAPFVEEVWDGLTLTGERRFEVGSIPAGTVQADPDRLAQALRNLGRNAIEHTEAPDGLVRLDLEAIGPDRLRFAVSDDGPGIPAEERSRVFERFHRTDAARSRKRGGAGLGLAIVKAIAEAHGGTVWATEPPSGRGARVELTLPGFTPAK